MTDFDAKAREIIVAAETDTPKSGWWNRHELAIAAALKAAYDLGYEDGRASIPRYTPMVPT